MNCSMCKSRKSKKISLMQNFLGFKYISLYTILIILHIATVTLFRKVHWILKRIFIFSLASRYLHPRVSFEYVLKCVLIEIPYHISINAYDDEFFFFYNTHELRYWIKFTLLMKRIHYPVLIIILVFFHKIFLFFYCDIIQIKIQTF